jgi:hypothetical protein
MDPLKPERVAAYMAARSLAKGGDYKAVKQRALEIMDKVPTDHFIRVPVAAPPDTAPPVAAPPTTRARKDPTVATG